MKGIFSIRELKRLFEGEKRYTLIVIAGAAVILILALIPIGGEQSGGSSLTSEELSRYEQTLEKRLTAILSEIENIGEINVMISLDSSARTEYGKNAEMLLETQMPKVRGVIVVCDGGDNVIVQEKVIRAVTGVFAISSTRVSVMK